MFLVECKSTIDGKWYPARQFHPHWDHPTARAAIASLEEFCVNAKLPLDYFRLRRVSNIERECNGR